MLFDFRGMNAPDEGGAFSKPSPEGLGYKNRTTFSPSPALGDEKPSGLLWE